MATGKEWEPKHYIILREFRCRGCADTVCFFKFRSNMRLDGLPQFCPNGVGNINNGKEIQIVCRWEEIDC